FHVEAVVVGDLAAGNLPEGRLRQRCVGQHEVRDALVRRDINLVRLYFSIDHAADGCFVQRLISEARSYLIEIGVDHGPRLRLATDSAADGDNVRDQRAAADLLFDLVGVDLFAGVQHDNELAPTGDPDVALV